MNKIIKLFTLLAACTLWAGCVDVSHSNTEIFQHDDNAVDHFVLRQVLEFDPLNPTGIDIMPHFTDIFSTLSLTITYKDGKVAYAEFDNGKLPFYPGLNEIPKGKIECTYDNGTFPPVLRFKDGKVLATMINNEPVFDFSLDFSKISYKYTFKSAK